ncbi:RNA-guided endonuclease InsQ/TnpB family protein [Sulfurisphaera ohwakuensis]|uniref:IS200/IS605 family element transposase accessory protein TnpB n=1 Tax=Sulfurisphaera ohwakuensis TaxID=69656 RepID=A0A650CG49_SULOH|nr:IS200/IS605 family accessory protein TnpB-related protein [Sulfurisphaera ohwakuensis]MBB5254231.1 IS605 OrfB family transposase [Sulfurisphaera ohwakuensis]QGR16824.1 IS200/IS605 family element transposase accessory protein TnpB [Sulfurisphaera ohwakuensis]
MERTVKLRVKVDYKTYNKLKEVEEEYSEVLHDAIEYGLTRKTTSFTRIKAGIYKEEREKHKDLPSHYIYTACEDASERLDSFEKMKGRGRAYTDRPIIRRVTVHLDDHLWKFSLDKISIATKRGRVYLSPLFPKIFWRYYNQGWRIASEARFKLLKGNVVELYIIFKKDEPKPYEPKVFIPIDLNENSVSVLVDGKPILLETNTKKITLGYEYRRRKITTGRSTKDRDVKRKLRKLREGDKKVDVRRKFAKLVVMEAFESGSAIVLEDLPRNTPEHMVKDVRDSQLRLRIYRSAFSSMKNAVVEKAREFGVPVILVNPSYTSSTCPVHGSKIVYQPDGGNAPRVGVCEIGKERWHRDVVALYNLLRRAGDVSPVPLGSKESHDPLTVKLGRWLRAKSLHQIMIEDKMIEMKV